MAVLEIPTRTDISSYNFTIELDEVVFRIVMVYNTRAAQWFFSIRDIDGNSLREGLKMVANWPLLLTWVQQGRPDGAMYAINPENDDDPDRDTLGTSAVFTYDEDNKFTDG